MIKDSEKKSLFRSSFLNLMTSLISKLGGLIFVILLARILLPSKFGIYSIVVSIITICATIFDFGVSQTLVRFHSKKDSKNKKEAYAYYKYLWKIKLKLSAISSIILALAAYPLSFLVFRNSDLFLPLVFSSLYLFTLSMDSFYVHLFYSLKKLHYVTIRETISQISKVLIIILLFSVFEKIDFVVSAILAITISYGLSIIYLLYYARKVIKKEPGYEKVEIDKKVIFDFAWFITLINIANTLFFYIDSLILGIFVQPEFVGYYKAAFSLIQGIVGIGMAPVLIILPYFMTLNYKNQEKILLMYAKFISLFAIPASFGFIVLGKYFLVLLFGKEYLLAYYPLTALSLLIFPQIIISALFLNIFSARNSPKLFFKLIVSTTALNVVLNLVFVTVLVRYSELSATVGASVACLISWIYYFVHSSIILKKNFKIKINYSILLKPIIAGLIMAGAIDYSLRFIADMDIIYGMLEIILGIVVYFLLILLLKFIDKNDMNRIKQALVS
jgi:O-antigen/teichoic acid export membrane protein